MTNLGEKMSCTGEVILFVNSHVLIACLHVPCSCPSKFYIVSKVLDRLTNRLGTLGMFVLSIIVNLTVATMETETVCVNGP